MNENEVTQKNESDVNMIKDNKTIEPADNNGVSKPFAMSSVYKVLSIFLAIAGFFGGMILGGTIPIQTLEYEYPTIQAGEMIVVEKFNAPLMFYVWIGTFFLFFCFLVVYAHLKNQEAILKEIRRIVPEGEK